jgi:hypothetical protein
MPLQMKNRQSLRGFSSVTIYKGNQTQGRLKTRWLWVAPSPHKKQGLLP